MLITSEETISGAWLSATEALLDCGGDVFTSIVNVLDPALPASNDGVRRRLDSFLRREGLADTQTVAGTIIPDLEHMNDPNQLYDRYERFIWPVVRRHPANRRGTYFRRMTNLPSPKSDGSVEIRNPLDETIKKIQKQLTRSAPLRCAYELGVYRPIDDAEMSMGFPCLSHVSFKIDARKLHVTAFYRNQLYLARLYGNLLGIARLLEFVSSQTGLAVGQVVCHAGHAQLDPTMGRRKIRQLLDQCRASLATNLPIAANS